ncbi:MAG: hypothetical protein WCY09_08690 [Candidatus Omnitrophota bacterium]
MSRLYGQAVIEILRSSGSLAAGGNISGSVISMGCRSIVGIVFSSASSKAASGLSIYQSADYGASWDYVSASVVAADSGSGFSIEVVGNAAKVTYINGDDDASALRACWYLRPV